MIELPDSPRNRHPRHLPPETPTALRRSGTSEKPRIDEVPTQDGECVLGNITPPCAMAKGLAATVAHNRDGASCCCALACHRRFGLVPPQRTRCATDVERTCDFHGFSYFYERVAEFRCSFEVAAYQAAEFVGLLRPCCGYQPPVVPDPRERRQWGETLRAPAGALIFACWSLSFPWLFVLPARAVGVTLATPSDTTRSLAHLIPAARTL